MVVTGVGKARCARPVLLVDDEPKLLAVIARRIALLGIEVLPARTMREGLALLDEVQPLVGIYDLCLPDGLGLCLVEHTRERYPDTPVFLITGDGDLCARLQAAKLGVAGFLEKPVNPHLFDLLEQLAVGHRQE